MSKLEELIKKHCPYNNVQITNYNVQLERKYE